MKRLLIFILLILTTIGLTACGNSSDHNAGLVTLPIAVSIDSSDGVVPFPVETDGDLEAISWESSDDSIASIDDAGQVTIHKQGNVTITATSGDSSATSELHATWGKYTNYTRIETKAQFLATFTNPANFNSPDKKYVLTGDIDFGGDNIEPIGGWDLSNEDTPIDPDRQFRATLDGRGYALMNFTISNPYYTLVGGSYFGVSLIPFIDDGVVRNLNLIGATFSGSGFTGSIAGKIESGTIENCFVQGTITATAGPGGIPAGGIAGIIGGDAVIRNVILDVRVQGGFIYSGFNFGTVEYVSAISETLDDAGRPNPQRPTAITTNKGDEAEDAALNEILHSVRIENDQLDNMSMYMLTNDAKTNVWTITDGYLPFLIRPDGLLPDWAKID